MGYFKQLGDIKGALMAYKSLCEQGKISGKSQLISTVQGGLSALRSAPFATAKWLTKYVGQFLVGAAVNALEQTVENPHKNVNTYKLGWAGLFNVTGGAIAESMQCSINNLELGKNLESLLSASVQGGGQVIANFSMPGSNGHKEKQETNETSNNEEKVKLTEGPGKEKDDEVK